MLWEEIVMGDVITEGGAEQRETANGYFEQGRQAS